MTAPTPHPSTRERRVKTNGIELHLVEAGPDDGPVVVLAHGFPELAYSWRHQLPALAEAGYHVLAPDQRGYGQSDRPEAIEDYDIHHLTDDLLGLLDDIGIDQAVFGGGHDWGSMVVGQMALLHPERMHGVMAMSVPLLPHGPMPPVQLMRQIFADQFFYIVYFQDPGVADAELASNPTETMTRMLAGLTTGEGGADLAGLAAPEGGGFVDRLPPVKALPGWLSQEELDHYIAEFTRTGFTGGINWYRNFDRNWETTPELADKHVEIPSMFLTGASDPVNIMSPAAIMDSHALDLRSSTFIDGAGHWVQQEKPDEVNALVLDFLSSLDLGGR